MWKGARFISCLFYFLYIDCQSGVDIVDKNLIALKRSVAGFSPVYLQDIILFFSANTLVWRPTPEIFENWYRRMIRCEPSSRAL